MLIAAVLGFGAKLRQTVLGLLLGSFTVYVINQIRIVGLFYLVEYDRTLFPAVHTLLRPHANRLLNRRLFPLVDTLDSN